MLCGGGHTPLPLPQISQPLPLANTTPNKNSYGDFFVAHDADAFVQLPTPTECVTISGGGGGSPVLQLS